MCISNIPPAVEEVYCEGRSPEGYIPILEPLNTSRWYITDKHRLNMVHIIVLNFDKVFYRFHSNMVYYTKFVTQHTKVYQPLHCNSAEVSTSILVYQPLHCNSAEVSTSILVYRPLHCNSAEVSTSILVYRPLHCNSAEVSTSILVYRPLHCNSAEVSTSILVYQPLHCNSAEVSTSLHFFPQSNKIMHAQICSWSSQSTVLFGK